MIGSTLAQYKVIGLLGKGGMGEVYRAHDPELNREVALKILPPEFARDEERLQRFKREARILASLNHPHIATIYGIEQANKTHFLVMELVEGENLAERMQRGRIELSLALEIGRQIADGLAFAHEHGVVHRDLKPGNVQLTSDGTVKLLDFGLAMSSGPQSEADNVDDSPTITHALTQAGTLMGTAAYMSPEALKGKRADARSDVWAIGCILYEMIAHSRAYGAKTTSEIIAAILEHSPNWQALPQAVPRSVVKLLQRCLAKDRKQRMHSAADIRLELQEAMGDEDLPLQQQPRRARAVGNTVIIAILAFVLGATMSVLFNRSFEQKQTSLTTARLMIPTPVEAPVVPLPETSSVAIAPNGDYIVYLAPSKMNRLRAGGATANSSQLYIRNLNSFEIRLLEGTVGATSPFISPDSEWIGFLSADLKIEKVSRSGGAPMEICAFLPAGFRQASWADNDSIYFAGSSSGIHSVDANGGDYRLVAAPDRSKQVKTYRFPHVLPGSRALLFTRGRSDILSYDDADVAMLSLESGEIQVLVRGGSNPRYVPTGHIVYGRAGKLYAIPFDLKARRVTGNSVEVVDGVVTSEGYGSADFGVSDTGTLIYVAGGPEQFTFELLILHIDGRIEALPQPPRRYGNVKVSPDGRYLAVSDLGANASIWIYDMQRETMTRLVSGWDNHSPVWHPQQKLLAFGSNRTGKETLWLTAPDGSGEEFPLSGSETIRYPSTWSPDGKWIGTTFESSQGGSDIRFLDASGDQENTPPIVSSAGEYAATFSPDGRWIAYNSDESGQIEIYVQEFPVTGRKWKISEAGGAAPVWSSDSRSLYYVSQDKLMHVALQLDPEFRPSKATELIEVQASDISHFDAFPDNKRFVLIARRKTSVGARSPVVRSEGGQNRMFSAESPDLRVVVNWFQELKTLTETH